MSAYEFELRAYAPSETSVTPEGVTLQTYDDQKVYLDFNKGMAGGQEYDMQSGTYRMRFSEVPVLDGPDGQPVDVSLEELQDAQVVGVRVRSEREQGLYFEMTGAQVSQITDDHREKGERLYIADGLQVEAYDHGGNDWSVSGRMPGLDDVIHDAEMRSAATKEQSQNRERGRE